MKPFLSKALLLLGAAGTVWQAAASPFSAFTENKIEHAVSAEIALPTFEEAAARILKEKGALTASPQTEGISVEQAIAMAMQNKFTQRYFQNAIQAARVAATLKPEAPAPELRIGHERDRRRDTSWEFGLRFPLPDFASTEANAAKQQAEALLRLHEISGTQFAIQHETKIRYYAALYAQEKAALLGEIERVAQDIVEGTQSLFDSQQITLPDLVDARWRHANTQMNRIQALRDADTAFQALANWIGWSADAPPTLATPFTPPVPIDIASDFEGLFATAVEAHPSLHLLSLYKENARADRMLEKAAASPKIRFIQVDYESASSNSGRSAPDAWSVGMGIEIPVFTRAKDRIALNRLRVSEQESFTAMTLQRLREQLFAILGQINRHAEQIALVADTHQSLQANIQQTLDGNGLLTRQRLDIQARDLEMRLKRLDLDYAHQTQLLLLEALMNGGSE